MNFVDSASNPIIAIDFDDTININGQCKYPQCGDVRPWAKEVINFMNKLGIKIVIWTSRDVAFNQDEKKLYDHVSPMIEWLDSNGIHYDAVNKSIQFAPYHYNGRKVYAHMYVDDRSFGWCDVEDGKDDEIFLNVLRSFLIKVCGFDTRLADSAVSKCIDGVNPTPYMIREVELWKRR